jgi:phenylacetate-CoA ligase
MIASLVDRAIPKTSPRVLARTLAAAPRELTDWKRGVSFRNIVRYAHRHSPFYRRKFDELGINPLKVRSPSDLGNFFTTTADIVESAEEFLCRPANIAFESSGTTGRNKRVYLSNGELDDIGTFMATGLFLGGVSESDRLLNALEFNIWIPGMITQKCIERSGLFGMAAGKVDPAEAYKRIPIYNFNIIMGEPTWLIRLTELAEKHGSYPLKFIIGGAEAMPDAARPWMQKVWQGAEVRMVYASVESAGIIAFEPFGRCHGYHIDENNFWVEIAGPGADGYGDVVFTTLSRYTMPLIRYKNSDVSRIIEERCPCGLAYRCLARMRGRTDELVVASGGNLYPLMFEEILKDIDGITSDWQIVFHLRGIKEILEFNIESRGTVPRDALRDKILANIRERYPDLWKNYSIGIFEMEFAYHRPGQLREGKHKLLRVVDKRYTK